MSAQYPVVPIAVGTLVRVVAVLLSSSAQALRTMQRVLRHRREASALARLDRHMLADIGITPSDVRDAFSTPLWRDPTELLNERVNQRRLSRPALRRPAAPAPEQESYLQPAHRRALPML